MDVIVIKLGSSVVSDEHGNVRARTLARLCDQVAALHHAGHGVVIVSSGAIAHGIGALSLPCRPVAMAELQAASAVGQGKLYRCYDELLGARSITSAQVLLTFFDLRARDHYLNARRTLRKLLDWRVVPVINENDTTTTEEISFGDNDLLAAQVAILLSARLLVLLSDADGLYDADPRTPGATKIAHVEDFEHQLKAVTFGDSSPLGTGGMRSKVLAAEMACAAGVPTVVASGEQQDVVAKALAGEGVGTRFAARANRYSSFKLWLRYAKPTRGRVLIDRGAARALREGGGSLLPVGVSGVDGAFEAGDAVELLSGGALVGKGICNYDAAGLRAVKGLRSERAQALMPGAPEEAVHRDYFVLA